MSLEQIALLAEIIGAIAVVVTLVYLAIEVRRNTEATRSATHQTQVDSTATLNTSIATNSELTNLVAKSNRDMSNIEPGEQIQLSYHYVSHFNLWHSAYWNMRKGLLSSQACNFRDTILNRGTN